MTASSTLVLHVGAGTVGLLSGAAALLFRKFPDAVRATNVLPVLAFLPLVLMIYWLIRVRLKSWNGRAVSRRPGIA